MINLHLIHTFIYLIQTSSTSFPLQQKVTFLIRYHTCPQPFPLPVEHIAQPSRIRRGGMVEPEIPDPHRHHRHRDEGTVRRINTGKIHQGELTAVLFPAADAFIIVDKIPCTIDDQPVPVHLDTPSSHHITAEKKSYTGRRSPVLIADGSLIMTPIRKREKKRYDDSSQYYMKSRAHDFVVNDDPAFAETHPRTLELTEVEKKKAVTITAASEEYGFLFGEME